MSFSDTKLLQSHYSDARERDEGGRGCRRKFKEERLSTSDESDARDSPCPSVFLLIASAPSEDCGILSSALYGLPTYPESILILMYVRAISGHAWPGRPRGWFRAPHLVCCGPLPAFRSGRHTSLVYPQRHLVAYANSTRTQFRAVLSCQRADARLHAMLLHPLPGFAPSFLYINRY